MDIIRWLTDNEKWLAICVSGLSLLFSTILTYLIIRQTKNLSRQQVKIEENINLKQIEVQKKQILVEAYPYKREIYCNVSAVLELCHKIKALQKSVSLQSKDPAQLLQVFNVLQKQYVPDSKKALWSMREAEYVLPKNIFPTVLDIRENYDSMCAHFNAPAIITKLLTPQEIEKGVDEEMKLHEIDEAINCCDRIVKHTLFIESIMPSELDISEASK